MNIMLFTTGTVVNTAGGAEKIFFEMANSLADRGHDVNAVAFDDTEGEPFFSVNNNVAFLNIGLGHSCSNFYVNLKTFYIFDKGKRHCSRFYITGKRIARYLLPVIKAKRPEIIIAYDRLANFVLKEVLDINIPVIMMFHASPDAYLSGDSETVINKSLEKTECVQVLLPSFVKNYERYIKSNKCQKKIVIGNPVALNNNSNQWEKEIINIGWINRHTKRQHLLILAFAKLKNKFPDWKLKIYGDYSLEKEYFNELKNIINENKLHNNVKFCGVVNNINTVLSKGSIFAFPSAHEGFPLALTEAMSAGLPCVGYKNCSGTNTLIKDGHNGYLVDDGVEPFAEALEKLMQDEEKRKIFGKNAKEDMKQYAPDIIWDKWEALIKEVVESNKK